MSEWSTPDLNKWYKDEESGDVTHYCVGHTTKERMNKPAATATAETYWFNPAELMKDSEDTFECKACGNRVVPLGDNVIVITGEEDASSP